MLISSVSCSALAGAWVETREAYNTASELHEVILRAGYHFDQGAGVMLTNAYNVGKWDELKHSYNEIEGWYPLFKPTDKLTFQPGGLINDNRDGSGGAVYLDTNYTFAPWFNLTFRYRYNHNNYKTPDFNGEMDKNDTHELANYWNFKVTDAFSYTSNRIFSSGQMIITVKMAKTITGRLPINLATRLTRTGGHIWNCNGWTDGMTITRSNTVFG